MSFRLTRHSKVLKPGDYQVIFNNGTMSRGKYWQIIAKKTDADTPRLGLAISKKVHRLAVERNKRKRIAREVFRLNQDAFKNWEFVVMSKRSKPANNTAITHDLLSLFNKATTH